MLTRCPACQTIFRVTPEQLAAREGRVRCGHCLNAFNARQNGVEPSGPDEPPPAPDEPAPTPLVAAEPPSQPVREEPEASESFTMEIVLDEGEAAGEEEDTTPPAPPLPAVVHTRANPLGTLNFVRLQDEWEKAETAPGVAEDLLEEESEPAHLREEAAPQGDVPPLSLTTPDTVAEEPAPLAPPPTLAPERPKVAPADPGQRHLGMAIGCLAAALLVQTTFLFRQSLTQAIPALRPALVALCDRLGCALPLPREAELISIETSDLHPEPGDKGEFVLHATLRNRAGFPQAYPHVELSLTDAGDKALVRRVFTPEEWAPRLIQSDDGFAPGGSAEVTLPFNAAGVAALGYRVYAFYPERYHKPSPNSVS